MYANGQGVARSDGDAVACYRQAAEQGHALAQYNLGGMYNSGRGVARDPVQAFMWISLAAASGNASAAAQCEQMRDKLSEAQLASAQAQAGRFQALPPKRDARAAAGA